MQPGRHPSWNVIAEIEPTAWLESVELASDDRLPLPVALRRRIDWCAPKSTLPLLAVIEPTGGVRVGPLSAQGGELGSIRTAFEVAEPAERASLVFSAMATYSQISLQPDGRLRLSPTLALHLGAAPKSRIWVGAHANSLTLWSDKNWSAQLARTAAALREALTAASSAA